MPLVVMVGGPTSGKTFNATKIKDYLEKEKGKEVILINEEYLGTNLREECYKDSNSEKIHRAKLKSEAEKFLDDKTVVILDSLNYIKGYRYELYCLVRNFKTRHCLVYCKSDLDTCMKLNILANNVYSETLLKDLYSRMEEPNSNNRWDNPLQTIYPQEEPPYDDIYNSLFEGKRPRDPVSTKPEQSFDSNFLYELDSTCQDIVNEILTQQLNNIVECVKITEENYVYLKKVFSAVELKKLKQEYIKISKMHPPKNKQEMIKNFVEYLNTVQDRY
jgi:protein KTI12